jgi:hypothetical protein
LQESVVFKKGKPLIFENQRLGFHSSFAAFRGLFLFVGMFNNQEPHDENHNNASYNHNCTGMFNEA